MKIIKYQEEFVTKIENVPEVLGNIYKKICRDLGVRKLKNDQIEFFIRELVRKMNSFREAHNTSVLKPLSFDEIFGK